jgi:hypothetical protein
MPFLLVFAVLAGAGAIIGAALAAPAIDPKNCMQQRGTEHDTVSPAVSAAIPEE